MFTTTDFNNLQQIMNENPLNQELITRLINSHQMELSMISHEIRNPLTLIYSTLQLIESQHPEVTEFKYWSDLHHDIEYLILLLNELSQYNNGERLTITTVDSTSFFRTLSLSFAASVMNTDIQFLSKIDSSLPALQCDEIKLREVIINILANARDAVCSSSHTVEQTPTIRFFVESFNKTLIIKIEDNGCGIPPEHLSSIFNPFITYKKNGTGLGLSIASRIIRAHNGSIDVSSIPSVGTTFTLTLPVEQNT